MPICASGEIGLGGSTTGRSVNLELGRTATAGICMDDPDVRELAEAISGQYGMNCFYGKSNSPGALGSVFKGGYYTGVVNIGGGVCYYMILAPNATGCAACQWKTTRTSTAGTCSRCDGILNTDSMSNTTHPAANFVATRSINGYDDWYLPVGAELRTMYNNRGSMPAGQQYANVTNGSYWTSQEFNSCTACIIYFNTSCQYVLLKNTCSCGLRAIRRKRL